MSLTATLAYLTPDLPGVGGEIKVRPEDFLVEEIPAYEPGGKGEHTYLFIEKTGLTTQDAIRRIAGAFGVRRGDVGYAGLKDKHAITRQHVSIRLPDPSQQERGLAELSDQPQLKVLWADRHLNKLRLGHLKGNRFVIRIRDVEPTSVVRAKRVLDVLAQRGVPNFVGEQRFGFRQDGHVLGRLLLLGDDEAFVRESLGYPSDDDSPPLREARAAFERGDLDAALDRWPWSLRTDRQLLDALRQGRPPRAAVRALPHEHKEFLVTAWQSAIFNHVLDARLREGTFDRLLAGDLAWKHDNGAVFAVDDATAETENAPAGRVATLVVSPSGPLWGLEMTRPAGDVARLELAALEASGVTQATLAGAGRLAPPGKRRPLRIPLANPDLSGGVDEHGPYIRVAFDLPSGAFATIVLREIMKAEPPAPPEGAEA